MSVLLMQYFSFGLFSLYMFLLYLSKLFYSIVAMDIKMNVKINQLNKILRF